MQKHRIIPLMVFLLLIASSFIGVSIDIEQSPISLGGKILYVGGGGPDNYTRIQDAIDNASNGDIVFVFDDSSPYYENIVVNKSINLIGENRDTTVIDGCRNGTVVRVVTSSVVIRSFTIQNSSSNEFDAGIYIGPYVSNNEVADNNISNNNATGFFLSESSNNRFHHNIITNNVIRGILLDNSHNNTISNNTITRNLRDGINMESSNDNSIISNNIYLNRWDDVDIDYANNTKIYGNTFYRKTHWYGVDLNIGRSSDCTIQRNTFNSISGRLLIGACTHTTITENNFIGSGFIVSFSYGIGPLEEPSYRVNPLLARNKFGGNYWYRSRLLPQPIYGMVFYWGWLWFPWIHFDWHPAQEPYDIGGMI